MRTALGVATAAALELAAVRAEAQTAPPAGAAAPGSGAAAGTNAPKGEPEPGHVALRYQLGKGSFGCENEATFRTWVAGNLHGDPFALVGAVTHTLTVHIAREAPGFRGLAELRDAEGRVVMVRDVLERTCVDVVDRMVVVVLLSVFPPRLPPAPPVPPAPPAACGPCDEASRKERDARAAKDEEVATALRELRNELQALKRKGYGRGMDLTFALSAGALLTANLTSNVGPGVWLHGEARSGPLMLGLELRSVLPSRVVVGPYDRDLSHFVALLTPCARYSYFFGCAVAGAGVQVDIDSDYPSVEPATLFAPLLQLGGRVGVEVPLGETRFAVRGWGEVLYSTPSVVFTYSKTGDSAKRPDVSAFFGVGFVVKFGDEGAR